ncbi:MAG: DUF177 domain-containing protein [Pyrinomonadaceae bacterium]
MNIDLASVGNIAKQIDVSLDPTEIDLDGENVRLTAKVRLNGDLERLDARAHLCGTIETDVVLDCTRCLEPVEKHLDIPVRAIFVDSTHDNTGAEAEISDEALDESVVQDSKIDLAEVVREQILLSLPEQIFCREDCKGLCPKCGANLNLIDCKCASDEVDPRWEALKNLK